MINGVDVETAKRYHILPMRDSGNGEAKRGISIASSPQAIRKYFIYITSVSGW